MSHCTYKIQIEGTVQGVGFRPFVYTLAHRLGLHGTVSNSTGGVEIYVNTTPSELETLLSTIYAELPPLAAIDKLISTEIAYRDFQDFRIVTTQEKGRRTVRIPPDVSICKACESELFDPDNRRYGYPFITCTHCGVRYSIIKQLPYDRAQTSMADFKMCKACEEEYNDPLDRRYHAQPIGCYDCGPTLKLYKGKELLNIPQDEMIDNTVRFLEDGNIIAVKGVGGYHLVCDATNDEAVQHLRERKKRPSKPYAVMVSDIKSAQFLADMNTKEEVLLTSKERPIVLLKSKENTQISSYVAPNISHIGLFLPYTPLHLLLLQKFQRPLVATSANVTDEPICTDLESLEKLEGIYDYVLDHNRSIVNGCDDSVLMVVKDQEVILRRARGYAPAALKLPFRLEHDVLALGANQKSTIAIGFNNEAILSPHIGDLNTIDSVEYFEKNIQIFERIYDFHPSLVMHDKHPGYESTKYALAHYDNTRSVQHHYAHILGVMAEKKMAEKVLGVAFDGTGYGDDGTLWGGEFLICDPKCYERVAHINQFKLLGGAKAIKEPKRVALSLLFDLYGQEALTLDTPAVRAFSSSELQTYYIAWEKGLNAPLSSSIGRLFDAVASLTDVCHVMSFEGESGMLLEELYDEHVQGYYTFTCDQGIIDILPMVQEILREEDRSVAVSKFFNTLVEMIKHFHTLSKLPLVLSGGVFQNRILLGLVLEAIPEAIIASTIPPNDGGIALGQIMASMNQM
ncbi:carbamoyltransferase HypF [Sulfurovum sp. XGS-02]|uniref:carbamoyltransferase HypF n=1 Tax=Sulfurovum sp. XGS-02 TaxID=2925411 RepID=UPI00202B8228|nr:carbamoyltransferase HypF [Sulfurovum sp. XGS-02]UPT78474.1 carbamoyltransferase HypF [Sulfurovum sp. XGS-02]